MDWDNENNNNKDWYQQEIPDNQEWGNQNNDIVDNQKNVNKEKDDIKPVNLPKGKICLLLMCVAASLVIFAIVSVGSCSGGESKKQGSSVSTENAVLESNNGGENMQETAGNNLDNSGVSIGVGDSSSGEELSTKNTETNEENVEVPEEQIEQGTEKEGIPNDTIEVQEEVTDKVVEDTTGDVKVKEVSEPVLGDIRETSAMVLSKQIFTVEDNSYAYAVNLVLLVGSDQTVNVQYFCPRKTYDALGMGDTVNVQYQVDSNGIVSVSSVSR